MTPFIKCKNVEYSTLLELSNATRSFLEFQEQDQRLNCGTPNIPRNAVP